MLRINDSLAGEQITFNGVETRTDLAEVAQFIRDHDALGIDTESTGINCYRPGWKLRTLQVGSANRSYVVPASFRQFIEWTMRREVNWIAHNGPHDIRSIDHYLGYETGVVCAETYIPSHHADSRKPDEGGTGHGLKELSMAHISPEAGKWEVALKKEFKSIEIPIPGEVYKSGPRKGQPKMRKAKLAEGWGLIDPMHPTYIAYAAADPILAYRIWRYYQPILRQFYELYHFDRKVQQVCDRLQRRAIRLDVSYTKRLGDAYTKKAEEATGRANRYGCHNIHSGTQIAATLLRLGARLTERTPKGQWKTDDKILRGILNTTHSMAVSDFIGSVLLAKQLLKRRESYTASMLREMDASGRIHPSINTLGARTTRMSVSNPPLQQLPTKDRESEE